MNKKLLPLIASILIMSVAFDLLIYISQGSLTKYKRL